MQRIDITSPGVSLTDKNGHDIRTIAVYDDSLLEDFLLSLTLTGHRKHVEQVKKFIYQFAELWLEGERRITLQSGGFSIASFVVADPIIVPYMVVLGKRPIQPEREVLSVVSRLAQSLRHKSPNAAALYQELQDTIKKYPTLEVKA